MTETENPRPDEETPESPKPDDEPKPEETPGAGMPGRPPSTGPGPKVVDEEPEDHEPPHPA